MAGRLPGNRWGPACQEFFHVFPWSARSRFLSRSCGVGFSRHSRRAPTMGSVLRRAATVVDVSTIVPVRNVRTGRYGIAAGDFDGDANADVVVGRADGRVYFLKGAGDGTFAAPCSLSWKLETFNAWAFTAGDIERRRQSGRRMRCQRGGRGLARGDPGERRGRTRPARAGNGTFGHEQLHAVGVTFNAGTLIADVGDRCRRRSRGRCGRGRRCGRVRGRVDGTNSRSLSAGNAGIGAFACRLLITQATACVDSVLVRSISPPLSTQNSPWGLAVGDTDGDADQDVWVGDRALYVYRFLNDEGGNLTLPTDNGAVRRSTQRLPGPRRISRGGRLHRLPRRRRHQR